MLTSLPPPLLVVVQEERNQLNLEQSFGDGDLEGSLSSSPTRSYKGSSLSLASKTSRVSKASSKSAKQYVNF